MVSCCHSWLDLRPRVSAAESQSPATLANGLPIPGAQLAGELSRAVSAVPPCTWLLVARGRSDVLTWSCPGSIPGSKLPAGPDLSHSKQSSIQAVIQRSSAVFKAFMAQGTTAFEDEDVFFASLLEDAAPPALPRAPEEAEQHAPAETPSHENSAAAVFDLEDDEGREEPIGAADSASPSVAPPADLEFSAEDLALRAALIAFYRARNPANLTSINSLVQRFRSGGVTDLWAQLAVKYEVPPLQAVDLLARTLYLSSIEQSQDDALEGLLQKLRLRGNELETALNEGHLQAIRAMASRGVQPARLRPRCWKALLGYTPLGGHSQQVAVLERKRAQFEERLAQCLDLKDGRVCLRSDDPIQSELLDTVKDEVDLTLHRIQASGIRAESLVAIVFLFLSFDGMGYVQGMSDMAAVIVSVLRQEPDYSDADGFWCFAALMSELKVRLRDVDRTAAFLQSLVGAGASDESVLGRYDAELAEHFGALGFEPGVVVMRWFMLLFAREIAASESPLCDVVAWWDAFLADPSRFELPGYACVALLLEHRDDLLETGNVLDLAEKLQSLPEEGFSSLIRKAWAICLFERRKGAPPFPPPSTAKVVRDMAGSFFSGIFTHF